MYDRPLPSVTNARRSEGMDTAADDLDDLTDDDLDDDLDDLEEDDDWRELLAGLDPNDPALPPDIRLQLQTIATLERAIDRSNAFFASLDARKASAEAFASRKPRPTSGARPRCGAKCRDGHACVAPAVWLTGAPAPRNGRCRMHGGLSTGPRTPEGRARVAAATRAANIARRSTSI